jgi:hypothetical protein
MHLTVTELPPPHIQWITNSYTKQVCLLRHSHLTVHKNTHSYAQRGPQDWCSQVCCWQRLVSVTTLLVWRCGLTCQVTSQTHAQTGPHPLTQPWELETAPIRLEHSWSMPEQNKHRCLGRVKYLLLLSTGSSASMSLMRILNPSSFSLFSAFWLVKPKGCPSPPNTSLSPHIRWGPTSAEGLWEKNTLQTKHWRHQCDIRDEGVCAQVCVCKRWLSSPVEHVLSMRPRNRARQTRSR